MQRIEIDRERLEHIMAEDTGGACGIAAIQSAQGATREVVDLLLRSLCANDIRGGKIPERRGIETGDGAGIMLRTDNDESGRGMQEFLMSEVGREVPLTSAREQLHGGLFFIDAGQRANTAQIGRQAHAILASLGLHPLAWKKVPTEPDTISARARAIMPLIYELIYAEGDVAERDLRKTLFDARMQIKLEVRDTHPVSLQPGTMVWKAMCRGQDLPNFFPVLRQDRRIITDAGLSHTRFGTNVLADWILAQPFELIGHNGEINTIREILEELKILERKASLVGTNIMKGGSDSANDDRLLQMLHEKAGLSLQEALRVTMHPSRDDIARRDSKVQRYYQARKRVSGSLMAIGPMAIVGMDREHVVAAQDSMGLRPARFVRRDDGLLVISSELGSPRIEPQRIVEYGRLGPGELMWADRKGKITLPEEADRRIVENTALNFEDFADQEILPLTLAARDPVRVLQVRENLKVDAETRIARAHLFGLNGQRLIDLRKAIQARKDPVEGMGSDLALPVLSNEPHSLGRYLRPDYSQVTNPSLDPVRNRSAFSLTTQLGRHPKEGKFAESYEARAQFELPDPLLDDSDMLALLSNEEGARPGAKVISTTFPRNEGISGFKNRLSELREEVLGIARTRSHSIIILSDRDAGPTNSAYIPPHLLVAYLKHELAREKGLGWFVSLVVDTGEVWDQHEYATLIAAGANAVHPRMIYEFMDAGRFGKENPADLRAGLREAFNFTLLRYMSKLGITEVMGYRRGKYFSTLGLDTTMVNRYFGDIPTNGGGVSLEKIFADQARRAEADPKRLRSEEERHAYIKVVHAALQEVGESRFLSPEQAYEKYLQILEAQGPLSFRDLLRLKSKKPVPVEYVMSEEDIIRKVLRGASMSLGALNEQSHHAVQLLFNELGSRACSGEGGVSPKTRIGGEWEAAVSKVRQIASGRFGVDIDYLADPRVEMIEIKIGQGAKPGVGGHLPGEKVTELIAEVRGVGLGQELISPPTNHNIYSIEDLAAFIEHLKACNPAAKVSVKITAGANVGNIAVGCVKAGADMVQVSGDQGGTGAATQTDKFNAGLPTELGVSNVDRALIERGMREQTVIGADGGVRTGLDVLKLIMLGADEVSLGTSILIAQLKCVFCGSCNKQICPAFICRTSSDFLGSAKGKDRVAYPPDEQMDRLLRAGSHFLKLMAHEIREYMAKLGIKDIDDLKGRRDLLEVDPKHADLARHFDMKGLFLEEPVEVFKPFIVDRAVTPLLNTVRGLTDRVLHPVPQSHRDPTHINFYLNHGAVNEPNRAILRAIKDRAPGQDKVHVRLNLTTQDRSVGATVAGVKVKRVLSFPREGVEIETFGEGGQGYAYGLTHGMTMRHHGPLQNEVCEIQNGGTLIVLPSSDSPLLDRNDLPLVGNTLGYGSRGGDRFLRSSVGDRCLERITGGRTVISGNVGKYFCEYATGGRAIVLGNFLGEIGPGMSGSHIYARDSEISRKLSGDIMVTKVMRKRDLSLLKSDLEAFREATWDRETGEILAHFETEKGKFKKVVAREQYQTSVFQYIYANLKADGARAPASEELIADLFEMVGFDIDDETLSLSPSVVQPAFDRGLKEIREDLNRQEQELRERTGKPNDTLDPEDIFMQVRQFAKVLTAKIEQELLPPSGAPSPSEMPESSESVPAAE